MGKNRSPREVRHAARLSQMVVAVRSGTSEPTVRLYEANPAAVGYAKRRTLDEVYAQVETMVAAANDGPGAA